MLRTYSADKAKPLTNSYIYEKQEQVYGGCRESGCKYAGTAWWLFAVWKTKMLLKLQVLKVVSHVCAGSHYFQDIKISYFHLEKVDQGNCKFRNGIMHWQISRSLTVVLCIFALTLTLKFWTSKVGQSQSTVFAMTSFNGKCQNLQSQIFLR